MSFVIVIKCGDRNDERDKKAENIRIRSHIYQDTHLNKISAVSMRTSACPLNRWSTQFINMPCAVRDVTNHLMADKG